MVWLYWDLTSQQQPGSYRGGDDDEMSVSLAEETGVPGLHLMSLGLTEHCEQVRDCGGMPNRVPLYQ